MNLFQLTYFSQSELHPLGLHEELEIIQKSASEFNRDKQISGILVYRDGYFLHRLEGHRKDIVYLAERIANDRRHSHFRILEQGAVSERIYNNMDEMLIISTKRATQPLQPLFNKLSSSHKPLSRSENLATSFQMLACQMRYVA